MVEKDFQVIFKHYLANNPPKRATVYELKMEKGRSIRFDRVYDHQVAGLRQAKYKGVYHKIADQPAAFVGGKRMHFGSKKPFDCLFLKGLEAYVVIMFYVPKQTKEAIFIDIDRWVDEKESSDRKSLTIARAKEIATWVKTLS
jgi:hypothetical protein